MVMTDELAEFILARIAEVEQMARDAQAESLGELAPATGEHWQWVCTDTDVPIDLDSEAFSDGDWVFNPTGGDFSLRSVEQYRAGITGSSLPSFAIPTMDELRVETARHIAYWDPARVLAKCKADRGILRRYLQGIESPNTDDAWLLATTYVARALAAQWDDHPDYQPEWASEVK